MELYFDNAASCRPFEWAVRLFSETVLSTYANQESAGSLGVRANRLVRESSKRLASAVAPGADVLWCNSGTEALAAAIRMHCASHPGSGIVTTEAEHPALKQAIRHFASEYGLQVACAKIRKEDGRVDLDSLASLLTPKVSLLALHHVNAETGAVQDLPSIRAVLESRSSGKTKFLADTTQSVCKVPVPWEEAGLDFMTVSGCKIGSPCGAALLFRDSKEKIVSRRFHALRGTDHAVGRCVPAAVHVLASVAERDVEKLSERAARMRKIRSRILESVKRSAGNRVLETIPPEKASPYILHLIFPEHQGAVLVRILESEGVSAAAGSACMAETPEPSGTLRTMGYSRALAFGAFRLSFWDDTSEKDAEVFENLFDSALKNY